MNAAFLLIFTITVVEFLFIPLKNFHLFGEYVIITGDRLQNLGLCSALKAFKQEGVFTVPHLL
jgi:hypothetical protein